MNDTASARLQPLLYVSAPPHIRQGESVPSIMLAVIIALAPALAASAVFYGVYALLLVALCVVASVGSEALLCAFFRRPLTTGDLSAVLTGLLLGLSLPPRLPLWIAACGAVFAIAVVKMAFGGLGHNFVNPALAARAFLMVSFPAAMSSWTVPAHGTLCGLQRGLDGISAATPLAYFKSAMASGVFTSLDLQDAIPSLFWGNVGGSLGATSAAAVGAGAIFLFYRGIIRFRTPLFFLGTLFVLFWIFSGVGDLFSADSLIAALYQVLCGGTMLGAFFFAADPVTSPMSGLGRILFGIGCGGLTFVIRKFGGYPDGVCWAVLLMNLAVPILDRYTRRRYFGEVRKHG
ncbi:MAG TPA: RnfABCDGE type electron transport complex subunit D [Chitinivibrionales bacterium]|nr:RnfABCDGE type electron transport complex subunit D [Chitinivibrionales bacterium]